MREERGKEKNKGRREGEKSNQKEYSQAPREQKLKCVTGPVSIDS